MDKTKKFYSRFSKKKPNRKQELSEHLTQVAKMTSANAKKIGFTKFGYYLGLLHDVGKYLPDFQKHLDRAANGEKVKRGEVDHSTAGAQIFFDLIKENLQTYQDDKIIKFLAEVMSLCCLSHHSGLIDMINESGKNKFEDRLKKDIQITCIKENIEEAIKKEITSIDFEILVDELSNIVKKIQRTDASKTYKNFSLGILARILLSCLIDADHTNSADFDLGDKVALRQNNNYIDWKIISNRLENHLSQLNSKKKSSNKVQKIRKKVSNDCFKAGQKYPKGCYKLEIPTGGGKTLSVLRFAFKMAKRHNIDKIIFCIPFTTIIEQNAKVIRDIVEDGEEKGRIVLEHHSNLSLKDRDATDEEIDQNEILTENWDAPIIFTTNVQILEILFGSRTSNIRRMHQLANSIIIFDEIQNIPIKCVHMFNNAINFLVDFCGATVILCTATQPLLDKVDKEKGAIKLSNNANIVENTSVIFDELNRVELINKCKKDDWKLNDIAQFAVKFADGNKNCLVVCNTTKSAKEIFKNIKNKNQKNIDIYHLSAKMCPAHRKKILSEIIDKLHIQRENKLSDKKIIVISTQVIEAGIDIDFNCGIRALAGLDSIAQSAGRINRNGNNEKGWLYIYNFDEQLGNLEDIKDGKLQSKKVIDENQNDTNLLHPEIMNKYYEYYFYNKSNEMSFTHKDCNANILELLSNNTVSIGAYERTHSQKSPETLLKQSFATASKLFKAIDAPTKAVIVPYGKGQTIINSLCNNYDTSKMIDLLKEAQAYSVNIYPNLFSDLEKSDAIKRISDDLDIFYLEPFYYSEEFGITNKATLNKGGIHVYNS